MDLVHTVLFQQLRRTAPAPNLAVRQVPLPCCQRRRPRTTCTKNHVPACMCLAMFTSILKAAREGVGLLRMLTSIAPAQL